MSRMTVYTVPISLRLTIRLTGVTDEPATAQALAEHIVTNALQAKTNVSREDDGILTFGFDSAASRAVSERVPLRQLADRVKIEAENKRSAAGYAGRWDDGGASYLEREVEAFLAGLEGRVPAHWEKYARQQKHEADPEFETYLRLRQKFEG